MTEEGVSGQELSKRHSPQMRYLPLDEGELTDDELKPIKNLVAGLSRLENAQTAEEIQTILKNRQKTL